MLENYFITQGREWERYAWIKARVVCGDRAQELADLVRPFVFRRHLDYSAFASMRDLHSEVRREVERRDILDNIKLGPGGIREIEFIAQVFQLIRGGHDAALRSRPRWACCRCSPNATCCRRRRARTHGRLRFPAQSRTSAAVPRRPADADPADHARKIRR